jgi:hypothetical protein
LDKPDKEIMFIAQKLFDYDKFESCKEFDIVREYISKIESDNKAYREWLTQVIEFLKGLADELFILIDDEEIKTLVGSIKIYINTLTMTKP